VRGGGGELAQLILGFQIQPSASVFQLHFIFKEFKRCSNSRFCPPNKSFLGVFCIFFSDSVTRSELQYCTEDLSVMLLLIAVDQQRFPLPDSNPGPAVWKAGVLTT
jgi:hypothetical protein